MKILQRKDLAFINSGYGNAHASQRVHACGEPHPYVKGTYGKDFGLNASSRTCIKSRQLLCFLFFVTSFLFAQNSHSTSNQGIDYGIGRTRSCDSNGVPDGLDFNPSSGGDDVQFVLTNPVCLAVIGSSYIAVKTAIATMNGVCNTGSVIPRIAPSPILDSADIASATKNGANTAPCKVAIVASIAALTTFLNELATTYGIAKEVYENTIICGANWTKVNTSTYTISAADYKQTVQLAIEGYIEDSSSSDSATATKAKANLSLDNKTYREWYYDGVEVEDYPNEGDACRDPNDSVQSSYDSYPKQKYYLKGLTTGNYNCDQYQIVSGDDDPVTSTTISTTRLAHYQKAYECCKYRSQNYICLDASYYESGKGGIAGSSSDNTDTSSIRKFCKAGSICTIENITFSAKFLDNDRLICAESYGLCPYNFTISGGSEYCDYYQDGIWSSSDKKWTMITQDEIDAGSGCSSKSEIRNDDCTLNDKANKCKNYCQYLTHCTIASEADYDYKSGLGSPYFSSACIDFVGDSMNETSYNSHFLLGSQRHFSAPIAQCIKETLENLFHNEAGHSECATTNEVASSDGTCPSGTYVVDGNFTYKKGNYVKTESFFSGIQSAMKNVVKIILTLSVTFYGVNILLGTSKLGHKELMMYVIKIGLIMFFAISDGWHGIFFDGVYSVSSQFSKMVFKIEASSDPYKRDGCQFADTIVGSDGTNTTIGYTYTSGKEYLAIWDTLDCKIARYLGFGPEASVANIVSLVFAGYFTGAIGIYFAISVMFFGFFMIAATVRALHIFLSSCMSIIIFVFVSPIVFPAALFKKTENIFKSWLTNLIGFCFQPMILFAYIAIFIMAFDKAMIGSATFYGTEPYKTISCSEYCQDSSGNLVSSETDPECDDDDNTTVNPLDDSVACLINVKDFGSAPGFELIGITIPVLKNILSNNVKERITTLVKGALVMFLLYKFMDEIPGITSSLIGGEALPGASTNAMDMFNKTRGLLRDIQKRASRGLLKGGKKAGGSIKDKIRSLGSMGKSSTSKGEGADSVKRSSGPPKT